MTKKRKQKNPKTNPTQKKHKTLQLEATIISNSSPGPQQRAASQIIFTHKLFGGAVFRANKTIPAQRWE